MASRVGADLHGKQILDLLDRRGMSARYIQLDSDHPTGTVSVLMRHGEPGYQIEAGAAWDFIAPAPDFDTLARNCHAVCFGSLAQRTPLSRQTIHRFLRNAAHAMRLFDINLRRNSLTHEAGYTAEAIEETCHLATIIKLNLAELTQLCEMYGLVGSAVPGEPGVRQRIDSLLNRFPVQAVTLTRGPHGTTHFTRHGDFRGIFLPLP